MNNIPSSGSASGHNYLYGVPSPEGQTVSPIELGQGEATQLENADARTTQVVQHSLANSANMIQEYSGTEQTIEGVDYSSSLPGVVEYSPDTFIQLLLTSSTFPPKIIVTGNLHLCNCPGSIVLPQELQVLGYLGFAGCTGSIVLPQGLQVLGDLSFTRCTGSIVLPQGLQVLGHLIFNNYTGSIVLPQGLQVLGYLGFAGCTGSIVLPQGLQVLGNLDFNSCTGSIVLPQGLQVLGHLIFNNYTGSIVLPQDLQISGSLIFNNYTGSIVLPQDLQISGSLHFEGCIGLTSLPSWITTLGPQSGGFTRMISLERTGLSASIINRLRETPAPGIQFFFSMPASQPTQTFSNLDQALGFWAQIAGIPDTPQVIIDHQYLNEVIRFLSRLTTTAEYQNEQARPLLAKRIIEVFNSMAKDVVIKQRAIDLIFHSLASCDDGIISALDEIELMIRIHEIENTHNTEEQLQKLGKSFLLLEMVNKKAAECIKTLPFVDEISVYLAFQIELADRFDLPVKTRNMIFRRLAGVTKEQIAQVGNDIEKEYTHEMLGAYLQTWSPWMHYQRKNAVLTWDSLPVAEERKLQREDLCLITQGPPQKPVLYNKTVYDYDAFIEYYRTRGKDPMPPYSYIDLQQLMRILLDTANEL